MPGANLLLSIFFDVLVADALAARHMGRGVIHGVECEHPAVRNFDTGWRFWIDAGADPVPRKIVITSKAIAGAPQYTFRVKPRKNGAQAQANAFPLTPPTGADRLDPNNLILLDELPPAAPPLARGNP